MTIEQQAYKTIERYLSLLTNNNFTIGEVQKEEYCFESKIKKGNDTVKLQVYFGKKGIKTLIQGNKDSSLFKEVDKIIYGSTLFTNDNEITEPSAYIGIDESGKGDYFGPLVIAAVYVDAATKNKLKEIKIRDSKEVSDSEIYVLSSQIKKIVEENYSIILISPEKYNQLYEKFKNLNLLLAWGHAKALENVLDKINCTEAISDKFGNEQKLTNSLQTKGKKVNLIQTPKAERFTAVAAASILAREKFLNWLTGTSKKLEIKLPKGASSKAEETADIIIKKFGKDFLDKTAKLHFKNTARISN
jgi:ribonuclease HIII